jgi:glycosyltransferase involved in cell wall biosynthesis
VLVLVTARDEAERLPGTLAAIARALPDAQVVLADDGSCDATVAIARAAGAIVVTSARPRGKGQAASDGATRALQLGGTAAVYLLCDADLGPSAARLAELLRALADERADVAIAAFASRGEGFGLALGFARWSLRRHTTVALTAPISGQRALSGVALESLLPFAPGFAMELAMTIAALRAGLRVVEVPLDLEHRLRGRGPAGFAHRARQLGAFAAAHRRAGAGLKLRRVSDRAAER